jgi:cell division protein FtsB
MKEKQMTSIRLKGYSDSAMEWAVKHQKQIKVWAFILIAGAFMFKGIMQQPQIQKNKAQIASLQQQMEYETTRMEEVDALKGKVNTDEYIEKVAREKLGLIKANEKVFIDVSKQD